MSIITFKWKKKRFLLNKTKIIKTGCNYINITFEVGGANSPKSVFPLSVIPFQFFLKIIFLVFQDSWIIAIKKKPVRGVNQYREFRIKKFNLL